MTHDSPAAIHAPPAAPLGPRPDVRVLALGTGVNLGGVVVRIALVFLHSLFAAHLFGAAGYGLYTEGVAAVLVLSAMTQLGMGRTFTRFVALLRTQGQTGGLRRLLRFGLVCSLPLALGAGLLLSVGSMQMARLFGSPLLASPFRVLGAAVPLFVAATLLASFTQGFSDMRYKTIALDVAAPAVELAAMLILAALGASALGLPLAYTLSGAVATVLLVFFVRLCLMRATSAPAEPCRGGAPVAGAQLMKFGLSVWTVETLMEVSRRASVLMLGAHVSSAFVGVFGVVQRLVGLGGIFLLSTNQMFGPMVADLVGRGRIHDLSHLHKTSARWILGVSLPFFIILGVQSPWLLRIFGPDFVMGTWTLRLLVASTLLDVSTGNSGVVLMMSGRPQMNAINETVRLVIIVALNLVLIPSFGLVGAALAIGVGTLVFSGMQLVETWKIVGVQPYSRSLVKILAAGAGMVGLLWVWQASAPVGATSWQWTAGGSGLALAAYAVFMVFWGLDHEDKALLRTVRAKVMGYRT